MKFWRSALLPYRPLVIGWLLGLLVLSLSRAILFACYFERVGAFENWPLLLLSGVRADLIMTGWLIIIPLVLAPLLLVKPLQAVWRGVTAVWMVSSVALLLFMELATPAFIAQYDVRPNRLFVEYLGYPQEVISTLWNGFRGWLLLSAVGITLSLVLLRKLAQQPWARPQTPSWRQAMVIWPLLVIITAFSIRSTLDHRPANPSLFAVTSDPLVNSLIISSAYSVQFALYNMRHEESAAAAYGNLPESELRDFIHGIDYLKTAVFPHPDYPTVHWQQSSQSRERPLNVVIILEESLGYGFVEQGLTPRLSAWAEQGWWFDQLYATGIRSVRGIEAVTAGFLPTPARSTVKLSLSQRHFFTLADAFGRHGYHTEFIYGGESHFDNMRSFFTGNGFTTIVDQNDFSEPAFVSTWGVSDEDLFAKTHKRFTQLHQQGQPFFSLVFSSSNHEPFELPDVPYDGIDGAPAQNVESAVTYADYALDKFLHQAKASPYWQDTLFLIVADHDSRVYGDSLVPINKFHIPGLLLGADVQPRRIAAVTSQIDLPPTLLSLAGISAYLPTLGQDLSDTKNAPANRAFLQFNQTFAYLEGDSDPYRVTILRPNQPIVAGHYSPVSQRLQIAADGTSASGQSATALRWALLPSWLYRQQRYYVPESLTPLTNRNEEVAPSAQ